MKRQTTTETETLNVEFDQIDIQLLGCGFYLMLYTGGVSVTITHNAWGHHPDLFHSTQMFYMEMET